MPVVIQDGSTLTFGNGTPISQMDIKHVDVKGSPVPSQACTDVSIAAPGVRANMQIVSLLPPGPLGNLSLNAYVLKANTVTLHFCNVSTQAANVPAGQYSFFAVR